ncbi:MAG: SDH family Clp fold serine proteinase [Caldisericum sp.]
MKILNPLLKNLNIHFQKQIDTRINTKKFLYAKIKGFDLVFNVENISTKGFLLELPKKETSIKEILDTIKKQHTFEVSFYLKLAKIENNEKINLPIIEVKANLVAIEGENKLAFKVTKENLLKFRKLYSSLPQIKKTKDSSLTFPETPPEISSETQKDDIEDLSQSERFFSLLIPLIFSLIEERKESAKEKRLKYSVYLLFLLLFLSFGFLTSFLPQAIKEKKLSELIENYERKNNAKVLYLIHKKKHVGLFGIPVYEFLEVFDAHKILKELKNLPPDKNILLVIHSPGGELLAGMQIAKTLKEWKGKVTVVVPYYAMSAGTLISLAANEILAKETTTFGAIDPQIPVNNSKFFSAVDIVKVCAKTPQKANLEEKVLCEVARKALNQTEIFVREVILKDKPEEVKKKIIETLLYTNKTHDFPFFAEDLKKLGLNVKTASLEKEVDEIVNLLVTENGKYEK